MYQSKAPGPQPSSNTAPVGSGARSVVTALGWRIEQGQADEQLVHDTSADKTVAARV